MSETKEELSKKRFTILLAGANIRAAQYVPSFSIDGGKGKFLVYYLGCNDPVEVLQTDELFDYYYKHWTKEKDNMLNPKEEEPQDPVGPVEGDN